MYNDAPAPVPAFDTRLDYYTGDPDQTDQRRRADDHAPATVRTRARSCSSRSDAAGHDRRRSTSPQLQTGLQAAYGATQDKPIVPETVYGSAFGTTLPEQLRPRRPTRRMTFTPASQATPVTIGLQDKAIIEGFDMDYGRMNAKLGGALPEHRARRPAPRLRTTTSIRPPTITTDTIPGTQIGALNDGTQIWRIDHQGVDTHAIHFHLFNVQLINRVAIDGQLFIPDANELGWKETVRMNPGQDVIVAMQAGRSDAAVEAARQHPPAQPGPAGRRRRSSTSCGTTVTNVDDRTSAGSTCGTATCSATKRTT